MTEKRLTILHTEASMGWGGQEIRVVQESCILAERGVRVIIACQEGATIGERAREAGLPVHLIQIRSQYDPWAVKDFIRLIKAEAVDIVHTHSSRDGWVAGAAGKLTGTIVVRSRHLSTLIGANWFSSFPYRYLTDAIIASGNDIKETLARRNKLDPHKIVSASAGVDLKRFRREISGEGVRKELGLEDAYPVVGIVAVLRSWKGHDYLLESVKSVVEEFPKARFVLAGDGPRREALHEKVKALGIGESVIMAGFRSDVPEVMAALDIFILPSYASEATSQVLPQALAMGKPVIVTSIPGLMEIVEDKVTGLLVRPKDPVAIASAIVEMAKDKEAARRMMERGHEKILKGYTIEVMMKKTTDVYDRLLGERNNKGRGGP